MTVPQMRAAALLIISSVTIGCTMTGQTNEEPEEMPFWTEDFRAFEPGRYHIEGNAYRDATNEYFVLTKPARLQTGRLFFNTPFEMRDFWVEFDLRIWDGGGLAGGADGMTFSFVSAPDSPSRDGTGLAFGGNGYGIEFDTYPFENPGDPPGHHIGLIKDNVYNHLTTAVVPDGLRNEEWHHVRIIFDAGEITVYYDDEQLVANFAVPDYTVFEGYFGFTAATGNGYEWHVVDNIRVGNLHGN
ncbi:MAG: L-type lectin-domain containing protein [Pseudomonadales bacterium]|nr:L-type lectin-domain containing protein [Pseudomonadales bacterium]MDP7597276.1 L-type lectin-domain containing protein [Pseudomonadales bacterium]HJN49769.1 L-type lectin-domain containing protein [Pseudomonadales bacterium]